MRVSILHFRYLRYNSSDNMWEYILSDNRIIQIYCNSSGWANEMLIRERHSLKSMFLGDFMIAEHETMSAQDLEYFTKMVRIFSESAEVMVTNNNEVREVKKTFRIFSPEAQDEYNKHGSVPRNVGFKDESKSANRIISDTSSRNGGKKKDKDKVEAIEKYPCKSCPKQFRHNRNLKVHVKVAHDNASLPLFRCTICPKSFRKRTKLSLHLSTHKESKLSCLLCNFKSTTSKSMSEHMNSSHERDKNLKCQPCDIWFVSENKLQRHVSYHKRVQNKTEKCKKCHKKLHPGLAMKRHMMTKHKKKLACALCGKEDFSGIVQLNSHIVKEHVSK